MNFRVGQTRAFKRDISSMPWEAEDGIIDQGMLGFEFRWRCLNLYKARGLYGIGQGLYS